MNKIFKVLWSKARGQYVAVDERRMAGGKGSLKSSVDEAGSLQTALFVAAAAGLLFAAGSTLASTITVDEGWNHTTITNSGGRYDINTDFKTDANIGVNKFDQFDLTKDEIANLHHAAGSDKLVNFVNNMITVDGTVNSIVGSKVGGSLFFVSPQGMIVGSTGVINAGSFTAAAPTQKHYDEWTGKSEGILKADLDESVLKNLQDGVVPINPSAVITVNGSINAANRISLIASKIEVAGRIDNTIKDFAELVNIRDENGAIKVNAGLDADQIAVVDAGDGSGDVFLFAASDTSEELQVGGFGSVEASASITLKEGAQIKAREDAVLEAMAGNGTYSAERDSSGKITRGFSSDGDAVVAKVSTSISVEKNASVESGKDLSVKALSINTVDDTGIANKVKDAAVNVSGALTTINGDAEYAKAETSSSVVLVQGSTLKAGEKAEVSADSQTTLNIGSETSLLHILDIKFENNLIPSAAVAVGYIDSKSSVDAAGLIQAGTDAAVKAKNSIAAEITATASTMGSDNLMSSFLFGSFKGASEVKLAESSVLNAGGKAEVSASHTSSISTTANAASGNNAYGVLVFNYTEHESDAHVSALGTINSDSLEASAENTTTELSMTADGALGLSGYGLKFDNIVAHSGAAFQKELMGKIGAKANTEYNDKSFQAGGAVGVVQNKMTSTVDLGGTIKTKGGVSVSSSSVMKDHHYQVSTAVNEAENPAKVQTAVAVLVSGAPDGGDQASSFINVKEGTKIEGGAVQFTNVVEIEWGRLDALIANWKKAIEGYRKFSQYADAEWAKVEEQAKKVDEAVAKMKSESLTTFEQMQKLGVVLSEAASVLAEFGVAVGNVVGGSLVGLQKDLIVAGLDFANAANYVNAYASSSAYGNASDKNPVNIAGSIAVLDQTVKSQIHFADNVKINAEGIIVDSDSSNVNIALAGHLKNLVGIKLPTTNDKPAAAIGGTALVNSVGTDNSIVIDEGNVWTTTGEATSENPSLGDIVVNASDEVLSVTMSAAANVNSGGSSVDGMFAVSKNDASNAVEIDDEVKLAASGSVAVKAVRDDQIQTIAGDLLVAKGENSAPATAGVAAAININDLKNSISIKDRDGQTSSGSYEGGIFAGKDVDFAASADETINAVAVAGSIALTGPEDPPEEEKDDDGGAWSKFKRFLGKAKDFPDKLLAGIDEAAVEYAGKMGAMSDRGASAAGQNSGANMGEGIENRNDGRVVDDAQAGADVDAASGKTGQQLTAAGTIAWNDSEVSNKIEVSASGFEVKTGEGAKSSFKATTGKWIGSWSGAAALNMVKSGSSMVVGEVELGDLDAADPEALERDFQAVGNVVGIAGALAVNTGDSTTSVDIDGMRFTNGIASIAALDDGTVVAEGLGLAVAKGGEHNWTLDAGVSVNTFTNNVSTAASNITANVDDWSQTAWAGEVQATGGTAVGVSLGTSDASSGEFGAAVAVADIENNVSSKSADNTITSKNNIEVSALASLVQVNTAVTAGVATGKAGALNGSVISSGLVNNISVEASGGSYTAAGEVGFKAGVAGGELEDMLSDMVDAKGATVNELWLPKKTLAEVEVAKDSDRKSTMNIGDLLEKDGGMTQVSVAAAGEYSQLGAAGAVIVNDVDNSFETKISGITSSSNKYSQTAQTDVDSIAVAAGIAAAAGENAKFSAAGSVVVGSINQSASNSLSKSEVSASGEGSSIKIDSHADATTVNVAGSVGVSVGGKTASSAGAAVVVTNTVNSSSVDVDESTLKNASKVDLKSRNESDSWDAAAGVVVSQKVSIQGSVVVNKAANSAVVEADKLKVSSVGAFASSALDQTELWTLAGSVGAAFSDQSILGAGAAVAYTQSGRKEDGSGAGATETKSVFNDLTLENVGSFDSSAEASDEVHTMALVVGASAGFGFAGGSVVNDVNRSVLSAVDGLKATGSAGSFRSAALNASDINALSIVGAGGGRAAGVGIAVNRINSDASSSVKNASESTFTTFEVDARSLADIESIGIGGSISGDAAVNLSSSTNLVDNDASASLENSTIKAQAASISALTDETIGTYSGQMAGGSSVGAGAAVVVSQSTGSTSAGVSGSTITEVEGDGTIKSYGGVADEHINDSAVGDISIDHTLADKHEERTISGINVAAESSSSFKNFMLSGAYGSSAAADAQVNVAYRGGSTSAHVSNSKFTAGTIDVLAGDYVNIDSVITSAQISTGGLAAGVLVNVATTDRDVSAKVDQSNFDNDEKAGGATNISAEYKEGVSALQAAATGAGSGAAANAFINVIRQTGSVAAGASESTFKAEDFTLGADHLGRINTVGVGVAASAGVSGSIGVGVNYSGVEASASLEDSDVEAQRRVDVHADRTTEVNYVAVNAALGKDAAGVAQINVNTIEGKSAATVSKGSTIHGSGVEISSSGVDKLDAVGVAASGSGYASVGALVNVNKIYSDARTAVSDSNITAAYNEIEVRASQDRFVDQTGALATIGGFAAVGANVSATEIGMAGVDLADEEIGLGATQNELNEYLSKYGGSQSGDDPGYLGYLLSTQSKLTEEEKKAIANNASSSAATAVPSTADTEVLISGSKLYSPNKIVVEALEDTANGAGVEVNLGSGQVGGLALAASVATIRVHHGAGVKISGSTIESVGAGGANIKALASGSYDLEAWQTSASLASGNAAYVDGVVDGETNVVVDGCSEIKATKTNIESKDETNVYLKANGISASGVAGGSRRRASQGLFQGQGLR